MIAICLFLVVAFSGSFMVSLQRAAHSIDLPLIAERVETEGELLVIREMGLYGEGQGEPVPWK
ncbi:hypothetical protein PS691_01285 [Pseudomonas fluorescens]|uniref:EAL domain-containing protein n=1 Tax=Pseudomonas fluorescens TaxID=294 RepID=A0A5E7AV65_PSEFL|nr:hypothetical protein [Pseudomonas fluorescens]VVN83572.1 hypothetical protein PS691_01285 [Pseudomonas fluorescens]